MENKRNAFRDYMDDDNQSYIPETVKKFLSFREDDLNYVIMAEVVSEIITNISITPLPKVPNYISGIINLRGQIVPIIDLGLKMGKQPSKATTITCIIVIQITNVLFGIHVDEVSHVLDIDIDLISSIGSSHKAEELVSGIVRTEDVVYLVFDAEKLMNSIGGSNDTHK